MPQTEFVMLTVYENSSQILDSLLAGACGYLLKRTTRPELLEAIRQAKSGGSPMTAHIARKVVEHFHNRGRRGSELEDLSQRETEVLELLAKGYHYKEIAREMGIQIETVRSFIKAIYHKLQVHSRTEAVVKFLNR